MRNSLTLQMGRRIMLIKIILPVIMLFTVSAKDADMDIWEAARKGDTVRIKALLREGADINAKDKDGDTILMIASYYGHVDTVEVLLAEGADVNQEHEYGGTALMSAAINGHSEIVKMLLSKGAAVDVKASDGRTPLMLAALCRESSAVAVVSALLASGADANAKDDYGWTPLMNAISGPPSPPPPPPGHRGEIKADVQEGIVKALLANGADVSAIAKDGSTALGIARNFHQARLAELLNEDARKRKKR